MLATFEHVVGVDMVKEIRAEYLILLFSTLLMAAYNQSLWGGIIAANPQNGIHTFLFFATCAVFLTALCNLIFNLLGLTRQVKAILIFFILISACTSYFVDNYHVQIDSTMLQNVVETDSAETVELLSFNFLLHFLLWGLIPAAIIFRTKIIYAGWKRQTIVHLFSMSMSILAMGLVAAFFYQDYASTFRNHRELRYMINPTNYISASTKLLNQQFASRQSTFTRISDNTYLGSLAADKQHRSVTVLVVGETARAEELHLNGYARQTTPRLEKYNLINFDNVSSCGTSTAVSLPCMFSKFDKDDYDFEKGRSYENLLDVVAASGTKVVWIDNNSGCKGICERVEHKDLRHLKLPEVCNEEECYDEVLLKVLQQTVSESNDDLLVVLHQKGSHGPAYYKRVPAEYEQFQPVCQTSELQQCSTETIVNAYDNTILYTDKVLSDIIDYLKNLSSDYSTAMMYLSDHGESLGEHGLYLHGTPYLFAPSQQTHVPMLLWLSENYEKDFHIDETCIREEQHKPLSQDNLFHSMLGMMNIQLENNYIPELDIFANCRLPELPL